MVHKNMFNDSGKIRFLDRSSSSLSLPVENERRGSMRNSHMKLSRQSTVTSSPSSMSISIEGDTPTRRGTWTSSRFNAAYEEEADSNIMRRRVSFRVPADKLFGSQIPNIAAGGLGSRHRRMGSYENLRVSTAGMDKYSLMSSNSTVRSPLSEEVHPVIARTKSARLQRHTTMPGLSSIKRTTKQAKRQEYNIVEQLGGGSLGAVYLVFNTGNKKFSALKRMLSTDVGSDGPERAKIETEFKLFNGLIHPNLVRYENIRVEDGVIDLLMEYVPGGSIANLIKKIGALPEETIQSIGLDVLKGLAFLHKHMVVHRDIKGANILLDLNGKAKICDFGCARSVMPKHSNDFFQSEKTLLRTRGSLPWMAPEIMKPEQEWISRDDFVINPGKQNPFTWAADVWSYGATVVEMLQGERPWTECETGVDIILAVADTARSPSFPNTCSVLLQQLLNLCFKKVPTERWTCEHLMTHPFFYYEMN